MATFSGLRKQFHRLSFRLTLWHALLFLGAALTVLGLEYLLIEGRLVAEERNFIEFRLSQYTGEYERGGLAAVRELATVRKGGEKHAFFVRIADSQNRTLFLRDADDWGEFVPGRLENDKSDPPFPHGWATLSSPSGAELRLAFERLSDGSLIYVGKSTEGLQKLLAGFRRVTLIVLLVFLPASIVGGAFLASRVLRPVQHLTAAAEQIVATAKFDDRVPARGTDDELDALVQVFNKMLDRIDLLIRSMRESLDNVAHDLRTPMTRLRQKAQMALESEEGIENTRDALESCVEEAERVMTLLNTLMDIAEAEAGLVEFQRTPVEVAALADSAVDSYSEVAEEKDVIVTTDVLPGMCVSGDPGALRRVFANLMDNAIKYTPPKGVVRISAERVDEGIAIHFADTGSGIPVEELSRIWDRLYRGDKSRSERGLGLGLSFVRAIVESHGGKATVRSKLGRGTVATVVLPSANADTSAHDSLSESNRRSN